MAAIHRLRIFRLTAAPGMSRRELLQRSALALGAAALPSIRLRAQAIGPVMTTLSGYMAAAKDRALPADVVEKAKHHILDTFAAMISGSELPPGKAALTLARAQAGRPVATVLGSNDPAQAAALAKAQFDAADNMTDRQGALGILVSLDAPERQDALNAFYDRFQDDALVLDQVLRLTHHPDFVITNPNRLRSLAGTFGVNHWAFHSPDGRGYAFLADMILAADKLNPQIAARLVPPFGRWRRFEPKRAELMRQALERIVAMPGLSKDVFEQVSKSLA